MLLGPSGCGKRTLLRMIAGLEDPTEGEVWIGDREVNDVAPKQRDVAMVFQSYALYPHKTVQANIEFPLKVRGVDKAARARRRRPRRRPAARPRAEYLGRKPGALSGGQRQRVALARAIVRKPAVFCMDEPLSNLDAKLRGETRAELIALHHGSSATFVYVTHDQVEAMTMGTRVAVMSNGVLQQVGHAAGGLRPPGDAVRRPVPRHAADERLPARRCSSPATTSSGCGQSTCRSTAEGRARGSGRPRRAPRPRAAHHLRAAERGLRVVVRSGASDDAGPRRARGVPRRRAQSPAPLRAGHRRAAGGSTP